MRDVADSPLFKGGILSCSSYKSYMSHPFPTVYYSERDCGNGRLRYKWLVQKGYDTAGRMTSLKTTRDGIVWNETQWSYDPLTGLCTAKTYADGTVVTNSYAQDGLLLRKETVGGHRSERSYDSARRLASVTYSDGMAESFSYDVFGNETSASNAVAGYEYSRDARGLATNETATTVGGQFEVSRGYDEHRRLVSTDAGFACGADLISYDAKSRLVSVSELRYTDFDNPYPTNWVEVVVLSNRYDHLDRRIQKITHEATHTYFYDGWPLVKGTRPARLQSVIRAVPLREDGDSVLDRRLRLVADSLA